MTGLHTASPGIRFRIWQNDTLKEGVQEISKIILLHPAIEFMNVYELFNGDKNLVFSGFISCFDNLLVEDCTVDAYGRTGVVND